MSFKSIILIPGGLSLDIDTRNLLNRMTANPPSSGRRRLLNDFIKGIKSDENLNRLSNGFDCLWFLAAHAQAVSRLNWVQDAYNLTEVNSPTWNEDRGYTGNASNMYLNTNFNPSTQGVNFTQNSAFLGTYSRTNATENATDIGHLSGSNSAEAIGRWSDGLSYGAANTNVSVSSNFVSASVANSLGFTSVVRDGSASQRLYRNGSQIASNTQASVALNNSNIFILARNTDGTANRFSSKQLTFAVIGAGTINQLNLFNRVESFLDAIGAGVV